MLFISVILLSTLTIAQSTLSTLDQAIANSPDCTAKCSATHSAFLACNDNQLSSSTVNIKCGCTSSYMALARACIDCQNSIAVQLGTKEVLQEAHFKHTVKYNNNVNTCLSAGYVVSPQLDAIPLSSSSMSYSSITRVVPSSTGGSPPTSPISSMSSMSSAAAGNTTAKSSAYNKSTARMMVVMVSAMIAIL